MSLSYLCLLCCWRVDALELKQFSMIHARISFTKYWIALPDPILCVLGEVAVVSFIMPW